MKDEDICRGDLDRVLGISIKKVHARAEHTLLVSMSAAGIVGCPMVQIILTR